MVEVTVMRVLLYVACLYAARVRVLRDADVGVGGSVVAVGAGCEYIGVTRGLGSVLVLWTC